MATIEYRGNRNLKSAGVAVEYTPEMAMEFAKCAEDPVYFIKNYVKIVHVDKGLVKFALWDFQEELIHKILDNRFVIARMGRQIGKTTTVAAVLLHYVLFNENFSIAILANKERQAREILGRIQMMFEYLPKWLQQGVVEWNKGNIELENGSKILASSTSSSAIRGTSQNCVVGSTIITICDDYERIYITSIDKADSSKYINNPDYNLWESSMYYTVYKITNTLNKKEYIGYHQTNDLNDGYMGSGKLIKRAIEKYGISVFEKEILEVFSNREDAEAYEALLVNEAYTLRDDTYNIALGGNVRIMVGQNNPMFGKSLPPETISMIAEKNRGRNLKEDDDIVISDIRYNSWSDAMGKLRCTHGDLMKMMLLPGNGYIDQKKKKLFEYHCSEIENRKIQSRYAQSVLAKSRFYGVAKTEEHKNNISKALKGKPKSEEHIAKINKNPDKIRKTAEAHLGMKRSEESKIRMSEAAKGRIPKNKGKIHIYNAHTLEKKLISKDDAIPTGWIRGVTPKHA